MTKSRFEKISIALAALLAVIATGWTQSPLLFLLYVPILLAAQQGSTHLGLGIGLSLSALYILGSGHRDPIIIDSNTAIIGIALSFPAVALIATLQHRRVEARYDLLDKRSKELSTLLDMSQMMDSAIDLEMTLNLILLNTQKLSNCQLCGVYLKDADGENLELKAASGSRDRVVLLKSIPISKACYRDWKLGDLSRVDQRVHGFYVPETAQMMQEPNTRLFDLDRRARSFACIPLAGIDGLLGMIYLGYDIPDGLTNAGMERLEKLMARVSFSLQRILLQQGFRSLAFSDPKTGLDNFRQFEQNIHEEIHRAGRYGHKLSLLLLDIDFFKNFNDTYGHPAGDALLAQLAIVLRNCLRGVDKPARYGGEEFAVLCPETGKEEARLIAERIRKTVAESQFALLDTLKPQQAGATAHVTVSIGFATYPQDALSSGDLIKMSDVALYAAKDSGRNTVRGHEDISHRLIPA